MRHYFGATDAAASVGAAVDALIAFDRRFSPAQLEHLCAKHASAAALAAALDAILDRARTNADAAEVRMVLDCVIASLIAREGAVAKKEAPLVARV